MATKNETKIVRAIMKALKEKWDFDGYHVHGSAMQRAGEPDIDGSVRVNDKWYHLKIEVKTPTGELSRLQAYRVAVYKLRGYIAGVVTSPEEAIALIQRYVRNENKRETVATPDTDG